MLFKEKYKSVMCRISSQSNVLDGHESHALLSLRNRTTPRTQTKLPRPRSKLKKF